MAGKPIRQAYIDDWPTEPRPMVSKPIGSIYIYFLVLQNYQESFPRSTFLVNFQEDPLMFCMPPLCKDSWGILWWNSEGRRSFKQIYDYHFPINPQPYWVSKQVNLYSIRFSFFISFSFTQIIKIIIVVKSWIVS